MHGKSVKMHGNAWEIDENRPKIIQNGVQDQSKIHKISRWHPKCVLGAFWVVLGRPKSQILKFRDLGGHFWSQIKTLHQQLHPNIDAKKVSNVDAKRVPKWCQHQAKIIPKSSQNHAEIMPKSFQKTVIMMPESRQNDANTMPTSFQNHPNLMPKSCQNHSKIMPKSCANHAQMMSKSGNKCQNYT